MRLLFFVSLLAIANGQDAAKKAAMVQADSSRSAGAMEAFNDAIARMMQVIKGIVSDLAQTKHEREVICTKDSELSDGAIASTQADLNRHAGKVSSLEAAIVRDTADADALAQQVQKDSNTLTAKEAEKKAAAATREAESKTYNNKIHEMGQISNTIRAAISALDTSGIAMLQGRPEQAVMKSIPAIKAVVSALSMTTKSQKKLEALVQASEESDDFGEYVSRGEDVLSLLHDLQNDAADAYAALKATEQTSLFDFNALVQQLNNEMTTLQDAITANRQAEASKRAAISGDNMSLQVARTNLNAAKSLLADLKQNGEVQEKECKEFIADAQGEIDALSEAQSTLSQDHIQEASRKAQALDLKMNPTGLFVQLSINNEKKGYKNTEGADQARAARFLVDMSDRLGSPVLAQIGEKVKGGRFDMVVRMIEDMLVKLSDIKSVEDWCATQLTADEHNVKAKQMKADQAQTKYDRLSAYFASVKHQMAETIASINAKQQELTKLTAERALANRSSKDASRALTEVTNAFDVSLNQLEQYYSTTSSSQAKKGSAIIPMLRQELTRIKRQALKWDALENTDDRAFKKMKAEIEAVIEGLQRTEKLYRSQKVQTSTELAEQEAELHATGAELGAQEGAFSTQKKDCQTAKINDEERMRRSEHEKIVLQEALVILKSGTVEEVWAPSL